MPKLTLNTNILAMFSFASLKCICWKWFSLRKAFAPNAPPTQSFGRANSLAATFSLACSSASWPGYLHIHKMTKMARIRMEIGLIAMLMLTLMVMMKTIVIGHCGNEDDEKCHLPDMSFTFLTPSADKTASTIWGLSLKYRRLAVDDGNGDGDSWWAMFTFINDAMF